MKNKKGFTLVELIALLGIIAIILLLTAPSLINQIETKRKNNYKNFVSDLCLASEAYLNHDDSGILDDLEPNGYPVQINIGELIAAGYIKSNLKNPKTDRILNSNDILFVSLTEDLTYSCTLNS